MSVWTTSSSGLETVLATLGTSVNNAATKGSQHSNHIVSSQPGSNQSNSSTTHLGHHTYINPTAPQFVWNKSSSGAGYQQKVFLCIF